MKFLLAALPALILSGPPQPESNLADPASAAELLLAPASVGSERSEVVGAAWDGSVGKATVKALFGIYRTFLSSQDMSACAFTPSCSRFSEQAIARHGFVEGVLASADRLLRDHPLAAELYPMDLATGHLRDDPGPYCLLCDP